MRLRIAQQGCARPSRLRAAFIPVGLAVGLALPGIAAAGASFQGVGDLPGGGIGSDARAVSPDGTRVVGSSDSASGIQAWRWRPQSLGSIIGLGDLGGGFSLATDVSDNGTIVGTSTNGSGYFEGFSWEVIDQTMAGIGSLPGAPAPFPPEIVPLSKANALSALGKIGGGSLNSSGDFEAIEKSLGTITPLGDLPGGIFYSEVHDLSSAGNVLVGGSTSGALFTEQAVRWTQDLGIVITGLGYLPGGANSVAFGVSADGSVAVGSSESTASLALGAVREPFRWTSGGGMLSLGTLPGGGQAEGEAFATNGDGSIVVGWARNLAGAEEAFIWDATNGMRALAEVLRGEYGVVPPGWQLARAYDISDDGNVVVGIGVNPAGNLEGFVVHFDGGYGADACPLAADVSSGSHSGSLQFATDDGDASCGSSGASVDGWYRYTADYAGRLHANNCGTHDAPGLDTGMDTVLSVQNTCPAPLDELSCNDDAPSGPVPTACSGLDAGTLRDAATVVDLDAGQSVLLRQTVFGGGAGSDYGLNLDFEPPDACADGAPIGDGTRSGSTLLSTNDGSSTCFASAGPDAWFSYTAPCTGTLEVDTCGSAFDTGISVHSGCPGDATSQVACNDDCVGGLVGCGGVDSCAQAAVVAGETYTVRVAGFNGAAGDFSLSTRCVPDPGTDPEPVQIILRQRDAAASPEDYELRLQCGGYELAAVRGGLVLPVGATGMDVDFAGCAGSCAGATGLGPTVSGAASSIQGPGGLPAGARSDTLYFEMVGSGASLRLCSPGEEVRLADVTLSGAIDGQRELIPLREGVGTLYGSLATTTGLANLTDADVLIRTAAELGTTPIYEVGIRPLVGDATGLRFEVTLEARVPLSHLTFGILIPQGLAAANVQFGGCTTPSGPDDKRSCAGAGDLGASVDAATSSTTGPSTGLLVAGARGDTLYVELFGTQHSGELTAVLNSAAEKVRLGVVVFAAIPPPSIAGLTLEGNAAIGGIEPVQDGNFDPCAGPGDPCHPPATQTIGGTAFVEGGDEPDDDFDGLPLDIDRCPYWSSPDNSDRGGVTHPAEPTGQISDQVGDVCQCGDVTTDGAVDAADIDAIRDGLAAKPPSPTPAYLKCNVLGPVDSAPGGTGLPADCSVSDVVVLRRVFQGAAVPSQLAVPDSVQLCLPGSPSAP